MVYICFETIYQSMFIYLHGYNENYDNQFQYVLQAIVLRC